MAPLVRLQSFVTFSRGTYCCNGFWGACNLSHRLCQRHPVWDIGPASCLAANRTDSVMTEETRAAFDRFASRGCSDLPIPAAALDDRVTEAKMAQCNGTLFRQCRGWNREPGICYNRRMMAVACVDADEVIERRRQQVLQRVGPSCDPEVEAWLGCQPPT